MSEPSLRPDQLSAMRAMLVSTVEADAPRPRVPLTLRRVGFGLAAVGAVAAVAAVATGIARPADPSVQASAMLRDAAAATVDPPLADGQFLRIATSASYLALTTVDGRPDSTIGYLDSQVREVYVPAGDSDRRITQTTYVEPSVFFGPGAQEFAAREWNAPPSGAATAVAADATKPVENQAAMPRDPEALLAYLTGFRYQAGSSDENVFAHVVDLLRGGSVASDLRAALYQALALMPSVVITEQQATLDGRVGTAIGLRGSAGETRQEIVIDPTSGEYIGVRLVTVNGFGQIPAGTPLEYTALHTSVVNSVPR
jgi:hypothetical protein